MSHELSDDERERLSALLQVLRRLRRMCGRGAILLLLTTLAVLGPLLLAIYRKGGIPDRLGPFAAVMAFVGVCAVLLPAGIALLIQWRRMPMRLRDGGPAIVTMLRRVVVASLPMLLYAAAWAAGAMFLFPRSLFSLSILPVVLGGLVALELAALPVLALWTMQRHRETLQVTLREPFPPGSAAASEWETLCAEFERRAWLFPQR